MSASPDRYICETCRAIDFETLLNRPRPINFFNDNWRPEHHLEKNAENQPSYVMTYTEGCVVCNLFIPTPSHEYNNGHRELRSYTIAHNVESVCGEISGPEPSVWLRSIWFDPAGRRICDQSEDIFGFCSGDDPEDPCIPHLVDESWDSSKALSWLEACQHLHKLTCNERTSIIPHMNLIDCFDMIIVEAKESMLWATLSYVWGNSECREVKERTERYRAGSRLSSKIPRTVADAITVTKKLGFRFLWVDEYCIDQSDEQHRSSQITRMDDIYRGGELTIVAAAGANKHHGLPGVSSTQRIGGKSIRVGKLTLLSHGCPPSELIQASKWFARAWTFQEAILSRRMLIFTERQTSFYCTESSWREESRGTVALEAGAEDLQLKHPRPVPLILGPSKLTFELCWLRMVHLAYSYSQREMTFEADALNGFLGVLHDIQRSRPGTYHLSGLPFFRRSDDDTDDDLARIMFTALAWILARESQASIEPRRKMFPSWTWVGWGTCISYWFANQGCKDLLPYIKSLRLETHLGQTFSPDVDWQSASHQTKQRTLDAVTALHFMALEVPIEYLYEPKYWEDSHSPTHSGQRDMKPVPMPISGGHLHSHLGLDDVPFLTDLVDRTKLGEYSCLMIGQGHFADDEPRSMFILVVQWQDDRGTAERVGSMCILSRNDTTEEHLDPIEEGWKWRQVRLV